MTISKWHIGRIHMLFMLQFLCYLIRNGRIDVPVRGASLIGRGSEILKRIDRVGRNMQMAQGLKLLKVDGVEPCRETIRSGEYPHRNAYYCVIPASAGEDSPNRILFDWLMSEDGQKLIDLEGYVAAGK